MPGALKTWESQQHPACPCCCGGAGTSAFSIPVHIGLFLAQSDKALVLRSRKLFFPPPFGEGLMDGGMVLESGIDGAGEQV